MNQIGIATTLLLTLGAVLAPFDAGTSEQTSANTTGLQKKQEMQDLDRLVETEKSFAEMALKQSVRQAFLYFLAEDGVVFQPAAVNAREFWTARPESPALLAWNPVWADISSDAKMGYTTGDWEFRPKGKDDKPVAFGQYMTIWKKQAAGDYKAVLDIGVTHEQPKVLSKQWASPTHPPIDRNHKDAEQKIAAVQPGHSFIDHSTYADVLADDVRLYRDRKLPLIGKPEALKQIKAEQANLKSGRVIESKSDEAGDLIYYRGVQELTKKDDTVEKGNLVRIWKLRNGAWEIALEIFTPLPDNAE